MIAVKEPTTIEEFVIVHPLYDVPEEKHSTDLVGKRKLGRGTRVSLILLRAYVIAMGCVLAFHMFHLASASAH